MEETLELLRTDAKLEELRDDPMVLALLDSVTPRMDAASGLTDGTDDIFRVTLKDNLEAPRDCVVGISSDAERPTEVVEMSEAVGIPLREDTGSSTLAETLPVGRITVFEIQDKLVSVLLDAGNG